MSFCEVAITTLVGLGLIYWLVTWCTVEAFFSRKDEAPRAGDWPPVSILKPVKGLDRDAYENFASFCRQDYPRYELLFGAADPADPALEVVQRLQRDFPHCDIRWFVAGERARNPKTSILAELTSHSRYPLLAISDSDIRVDPLYLRSVVKPLLDPQVGVVTCLYRCQTPVRFSTRWEILYLETDFLPAVILAHRLLCFCVGLGSTLAVRAADLARAGGWGPMGDYLADDYQLAARVSALGGRVHVSRHIVTQVLGGSGFREQWDREIRWARGVRSSCPYCYPGRLLTLTIPLALALLLVGGPNPLGLGLLGAAVALRSAVAWRMRRHLGQPPRPMELLWLPLRDMATATSWTVAALGRGIRWRGRMFWLDRAGRLHDSRQSARVGLGASVIRGLGELGAWAGKPLVRQLDRVLRKLFGIQEFSADPQCIFRISVATSAEDFKLPDGTPVRRGERIGDLHLWNEHLPQIPASGVDLGWAAQMRHQGTLSFAELARTVRCDPRLQDVKAWRAVVAPRSKQQFRLVDRLMRTVGFEPAEAWRGNLLSRWHDLGDDVLRWLLTWTYNPGGMRSRAFLKQRQAYWISQPALLSRYPQAADAVSAPILPLVSEPAPYQWREV